MISVLVALSGLSL